MSSDIVEIVEVREQENLNITLLPDEDVEFTGVEPDEYYCLSDESRNNVRHLNLTELEWKIYFAINPEASLNTLKDELSVSEFEIVRALLRLLANKIIEPKKVLSYDEFVALTELLDESVSRVESEEEYVLTIPSKSKLVESGESTRLKQRNANVTTLDIQKKPEKNNARKYSGKIKNLRCLVEVVCQYKGDERRGKLAVYRIFLKVPREDFVALGFGSFLFLGKRSKPDENEKAINPELLTRLIRAAQEEIGRDPEKIYEELLGAGKLPAHCLEH